MKTQEERIDDILSVLLEYTEGNFSREIPLSEGRDSLDAIGTGINSVGQELKESLQEQRRKNVELEEKQRLMEMKNKELEQIAFITAHDLREPLVLIKSFAEKLKLDYKNQLDETADLYIDFIYNASTRLDELMNGLMQFTQIGKERFSKTVNLNQIMEKVLANEESHISELDATIEIDELPHIVADPDELSLLFSHLLSNALKFHNPQRKPKIQVQAEDFEEKWLLSISDNGIGIEKSHHEKIFRIFRQLNSREKYLGIGLGLPHCRKVVEKYGGNLWVESSPGEGSTFYFTLPNNDSKQKEKTE